jgi:VanZ family protein
MNKLKNKIQKNPIVYQRIYKILFYAICLMLLVSAVIKFGGAMNRTKVGIGDFKVRLDHFLHAVAYFLFSLYYITGKYFGLDLFKSRKHITFFLILFAVGFLAEVMQIWVPYRSYSLMDMLSNLVGIGMGYIVTLFLIKRISV